MSTALDIRPQQAPAHQDAALAIRPGQATWDKFQEAALSQIGLKDASNADRAVFLHQCQRTGLDPFARQIYMIARNEKVPGTKDQWRTKWTIQTGIDGWRVIRDRAERREGVRGILSRFTYYDHEDNERKVWTRREPPAAIEVTYTVRDRNGINTPYTSILRFDEYVQTGKDGQPVAQWAVKDVHMLEKCTEADVYRKAFPQDFAGISLDDAMPPAEAAPAPVAARVTAADIRGRTRPQVRAEIVRGPEDASPAETTPPSPPAEPAGEAPNRPAMATGGQVGIIEAHFERLGYDLGSPDDNWAAMSRTAKLAGTSDLTWLGQLTQDQADRVKERLHGCKDIADLDRLLEDGEVPGDG